MSKYIIVMEDKIKGSTMVKRDVLAVCEQKELNKKVNMVKNMNKKDCIKVFKEVKINIGNKKWE